MIKTWNFGLPRVSFDLMATHCNPAASHPKPHTQSSPYPLLLMLTVARAGAERYVGGEERAGNAREARSHDSVQL